MNSQNLPRIITDHKVVMYILFCGQQKLSLCLIKLLSSGENMIPSESVDSCARIYRVLGRMFVLKISFKIGKLISFCITNIFAPPVE